jgi:hypothetical protein
VYCIDILKLLTSLISSAFIDYVEYKFPRYIKDINDNRVIKIDVVFKVKFKSIKWLTVPLKMFAIIRQVFKCPLINVMPYSFKHVL